MMGQIITKKELNDLALENHIKSLFIDLKFLRWMLSVYDWNKNIEFVFSNPFAEELDEWYEWYKKGMTPDEAINEEQRLYG